MKLKLFLNLLLLNNRAIKYINFLFYKIYTSFYNYILLSYRKSSRRKKHKSQAT